VPVLSSPLLRYGLFFVALFAIGGILLPFWPTWMKGRGRDEAEIGLILASAMAIRTFAHVGVGMLADRIGERRRPLIALGIAALLTHALFYPTIGFWSCLAVALLTACALSPMYSLGESAALLAVRARGVDYGRLRGVGSIAFIVAALAAGWLLEGLSGEWVLAMALVMLAALVGTTFLLPDVRVPPAPGRRRRLLALIANPRFLLFVFAAWMLHGSHAALYGFSTLHWLDAGHDKTTIGILWGVGVACEVTLFLFASRVTPRISPLALMALAGAGGVVRWIGLAEVTALPGLVLLQALHGATFGLAHLGAMMFLVKAIAPEDSGSAQGVYAALPQAIGMGVAMAVAGFVYSHHGAAAFLLMAAMSAAGGLAALALRRRWRGEVILG